MNLNIANSLFWYELGRDRNARRHVETHLKHSEIFPSKSTGFWSIRSTLSIICKFSPPVIHLLCIDEKFKNEFIWKNVEKIKGSRGGRITYFQHLPNTISIGFGFNLCLFFIFSIYLHMNHFYITLYLIVLK